MKEVIIRTFGTDTLLTSQITYPPTAASLTGWLTGFGCCSFRGVTGGVAWARNAFTATF